jgi:hypothetical protein
VETLNDLPENDQIEAHILHIALMLKKDSRPFEFREIAEQTEKEEWARFDYVLPSLAHMIKRGQVEYNPKLGYMLKGAALKISRRDFDEMLKIRQKEYQRIGGIVE